MTEFEIRIRGINLKTKNIIEDWSKNGISKYPLLLHGTSIEAVVILIKEGHLPASKKKEFYFTPINCNFEKSPYAIPLKLWKYTKRKAISQSEFYAQINSMEQYLINKLGFLPEWFPDVPHTKTNLFYWLVEDTNVDKPKQELKKLVNELFNHRGTIIEPNEDIFKFSYYPGDDKNTIAFYCPDGLPSSCIRGIQPLGNLERNIITHHL